MKKNAEYIKTGNFIGVVLHDIPIMFFEVYKDLYLNNIKTELKKNGVESYFSFLNYIQRRLFL